MSSVIFSLRNVALILTFPSLCGCVNAPDVLEPNAFDAGPFAVFLCTPLQNRIISMNNNIRDDTAFVQSCRIANSDKRSA